MGRRAHSLKISSSFLSRLTLKRTIKDLICPFSLSQRKLGRLSESAELIPEMKAYKKNHYTLSAAYLHEKGPFREVYLGIGRVDPLNSTF